MSFSSSLRYILLGFVILGVSLTQAAPRAGCPPGWFYYKAYCYGYFRFRLSWSDAEFECASYGHGAHLASLMDPSESAIIASHVAAYPGDVDVWIGLHDPEQNRRWKWNDGSMYNFRNWKNGEPNNLHNQEYCVELTTETTYTEWNDAPCSTYNNFVCKFKP